MSLLMDRRLIFLSHYIPNLTSFSGYSDVSFSPAGILVCLILGIVSSLILMGSKFVRTAAFICWSCFVTITIQNRLIKELQFDFMGLLLLIIFMAPAYSNGTGVKKIEYIEYFKRARIPIFFLLVVSFFVSGLSKFNFAPWRDGSIVEYLITSSFSNPVFSTLLSALPISLKSMFPYLLIAMEVLPLPLFLIKKLRPLAWIICVLLQLGMLLAFQLPQISTFYLILLVILFEENWAEKRWNWLRSFFLKKMPN